MRYAIISDIHGNLAALEKVLERIDREKCDKIVCLGDIVGYGPFPNECVALVKKNCDFCLIGNHDHAALDLTDTAYFNTFAKIAIMWTRKALSKKSKEFLAGLPLQKSENDTLFVHATPCEPIEWEYVLSSFDAMQNFYCFNEPVCFIGHSHVPVVFSLGENKEISISRKESTELVQNSRYIINVGSVGQPRDGESKSAFVLFDTDTQTHQLVRVEYDIHATQRAMLKFDLPLFLVERLAHGQ
ncbi:MAG: metallophosphoesterase [Actinobacteria bacterium]|nr:metallophosphoesterase [Actinomycetota bacterium]